MSRNKSVGDRGESIAVDFLIGRGYSILEKNWRFRHKEIDIIARDDSELVIVEVKSRTGEMVENIVDTIDRRKIKNLVIAANAYVLKRGVDLNIRFDIIVVIFKDKRGEVNINHIKDAFISPLF